MTQVFCTIHDLFFFFLSLMRNQLPAMMSNVADLWWWAGLSLPSTLPLAHRPPSAPNTYTWHYPNA